MGRLEGLALDESDATRLWITPTEARALVRMCTMGGLAAQERGTDPLSFKTRACEAYVKLTELP
jgi:hypothetical protein